MFSRIAVVNRGEAAMRLITAVADLRAEAAEPAVIALHTPAERTALFVREADEAIEITSDTTSPYLDYAELERALVASRADAVWVGWGFVAEHADFADLCGRLGIVFVGPSGDVMRLLGDKIGAKQLAESTHVPVAAWSGGAVPTVAAAREAAEQIGYPLMVKATSGGGGRGIRRVNTPDELADAFERARSEGEKSFGDPTVFMEQVVENARHIEVQIAADVDGNVWALGVRDCSVQRRNQKVIEESHSVALSPEESASIAAAAVRLASAAHYRNVGTVEFLFQPETRDFAFLEVNTRLQVEHPVTEATTGVDLVRLQLQLAAGWGLAGDAPATSGHAIEARLNAEDVDAAFAPAPGELQVLRFPGGPGIRVDTGFAEGDVVSSDYDSMIAKIIAVGSTREEARHRLRRALMQTSVVISGGVTNKSFLISLLDSDPFRAGIVDTSWLDRSLEDGSLSSSSAGRHVALVATAIDAWEAEEALARQSFFISAGRGRPSAELASARTFDLRAAGERYSLTVSCVGPGSFRVNVDEPAGDDETVTHEMRVAVEHMGAVESRITIGSHRHRVVSMHDGSDVLVEVDAATHRVSLDDGGAVRAPAPSLVVMVLAAEGDEVTRGTPLAIVEAMKVETTLTAPFDARVTAVLAGPNTQADAGTVLLKLEPLVHEDEADSAEAEPSQPLERVSFSPYARQPELTEAPRARCLEILTELRWLLLGFERPQPSLTELLAKYRRVRSALSPNDAVVLAAEVSVFRAFADVVALSRNRPANEVVSPEAHSPQEYFHRYLRALDADAEGLSEDFIEKLTTALGHFDIAPDAISPGPGDEQVEQAAHAIFKGQLLAEQSQRILLELLDSEPPDLTGVTDETIAELRAALNALVSATQLRYPALADAARTYTYVTFDQPVLESTREASLDESRRLLQQLAARPDSEDRPELMAQLVTSPYRLIRLLNDRNGDGGFADRDDLIEVLTRRNYQIRELENFRIGQIDDGRILTVGYARDDERFHVIAALCDGEDFVTTATAASTVSSHAPDTDKVVIDLYLRWPDGDVDPDELVAQLAMRIATIDYPAHVLRISVSVVAADGVVTHATFRQQSGRFIEDPVVRGLHPMIAQRLQLGRLGNFTTERIESPEDTHLFRLVGRENPEDVRLLAAAEIRDLTMVRDGDGRVVELPELERQLITALDGMRSQRNQLPEREQPSWNRVVLYVWPVVDVPVEDFGLIAQRLAPLTTNLGVEKVLVQAKVAGDGGEVADLVVRIGPRAGGGVDLTVTDVPVESLRPLDAYDQRVLAARRRGAPYPYEIVPLIVGDKGTFVEYDLYDNSEGDRVFAKVERPPGGNSAGVVVGLVSTATERYPEGMTRVAILGDPTKSLGNVSEPECARILGAFDLAETLDAPVEWFALSSGARISMDSGTENMDWISRVLRRIVEFTQSGGEVNVIVTGINVGAQPYWNAEATMLMHTRGILVMTPESAMVLTGKQALDYSGGVSAEDNFGIGGFDRIMGPNGQAQYWAPDLNGAVDVLFAHYDHSYRARGERFPRAALTDDPIERDVSDSPHEVDGLDFTTVGDIFSDDANPGRKKPFDIRALMTAVADSDHEVLERWAPMRDAETVVAFEAHLGGHPIALIGIESKPMSRHGRLPADGPDQWTAGTLFPLSSKKLARAVNAASGSRPLVVLANLSGFDGSPESLRRQQLEFGAEIGRAIVNFDGPIVFCVVSRFHGGAFVVFSGSLHDNMQVLAVEGTYASVLGGAPAAAVVFAGDVRRRVRSDERMSELAARLDASSDAAETLALRTELAELETEVHAEKLGEVAAEFDEIHSIERALAVGSVDQIISADQLRPRLVAAIRKGMSEVTGGPYEEPDWPQPFEAAQLAVVPIDDTYTPPAAEPEAELVHWLDDVPGFISEDARTGEVPAVSGDAAPSDVAPSDVTRSAVTARAATAGAVTPADDMMLFSPDVVEAATDDATVGQVDEVELPPGLRPLVSPDEGAHEGAHEGAGEGAGEGVVETVADSEGIGEATVEFFPADAIEPDQHVEPAFGDGVVPPWPVLVEPEPESPWPPEPTPDAAVAGNGESAPGLLIEEPTTPTMPIPPVPAPVEPGPEEAVTKVVPDLLFDPSVVEDD